MTAHLTGTPSRRGETRTGASTDERLDAALQALDDETCREVLVAIDDAALTAAEVANTCDLPRSTAYRKLDVLANSPLVEERIRVRPDGKHASEYTQTATSVVVSIEDDGFALTVFD